MVDTEKTLSNIDDTSGSDALKLLDVEDGKLCSDSMAKKTQQLRNCLENDKHSCDFTWSLFQSALNSYRFDSCLRPYPNMFLKDGFKDPVRMKVASEIVPNMETLRKTIHNSDIPDDTLNLLYWVLVCQRDPYLKIVLDEHSRPNNSILFDYISKEQLNIQPNFVYQVIYSDQHELQWLSRKQDNMNSIFAFHGSRLDNFYSIIKFGLQQHMSGSETLFGQGIYLSSELLLSLTYSPAGTTWKKSIYGCNYSIVALCEIINDKRMVKCNDAVNVGSIGGRVPDKYYVVVNSEYVRVRYLLVFKQNQESSRVLQNPYFRWFKKHKLLIILALYVLLLLYIAFLNSSGWQKLQRYFRMVFDRN